MTSRQRHVREYRLTYEFREFNELVNMDPDQLKEWLGSDESARAGWSKDDGSGESIGHERCVPTCIVMSILSWSIASCHSRILLCLHHRRE